MASVQMPLGQRVADPITIPSHEEQIISDSEDPENIPYHARENAQPFTYGNVPEGFSTSELNHVTVEEVTDIPKAKYLPNVHASSPSPIRKPTRPSISPSRPVLKKTPSRKEFEEMLLERKEQANREQNNTAVKLAQNAAIQKDLDALQEKLNKSIRFAENEKASLSSNNEKKLKSKEIVRQVESIDLPDATQALVLAKDFDPVFIIAEPKRPETPAFPSNRCISPYPAIATSTPLLPKTISSDEQKSTPEQFAKDYNQEFYRFDSCNNEMHNVEPHLVKFAKDSSEYWYKPHMTREEAVALLRNATPGTFLIRNSTTYQNAYGLVLRVTKPPPGVAVGATNGDELVRHFLLEPTTRGVRLKGCANEPIFTSLSAFVFQHTINQLALPCTLIIPDHDLQLSSRDADIVNKHKQILSQGAACNVLYLFTCNMESLTGDEAIRRAVYEMYAQPKLPTPVEVHFKVSQQGITLTDNTRTVFFRRHYAAHCISHLGLDPDHRFWSVIANDEGLQRAVNKSIFAFVARPLTGSRDNECHIFCDLAATQPATAIVSFAYKVLPLNISNPNMI